jgi:phosphohistidine swiveling domain-containing protein
MAIKKAKKIGNSKRPTSFGGAIWDIFVTRNMSFWHQCLSSMGIYHHLADFGVSLNVEQVAIIFNGTETTVFENRDHVGTENEVMLGSALGKPGMKAIEGKYFQFSKSLLVALEVCKHNLTLGTWNNFMDAYSRFCAGLQITARLGRAGLERLETDLRKLGYSAAEIPGIIATITYPRRYTPLFVSRLELLRLGVRIQKEKLSERQAEKLLVRWHGKHRHIPVNFCEEPWTIAEARTQLSANLRKNCAKELRSLEREHQKKITAARQLLGRINDKNITALAAVIAEATFLNEFRKNSFSRVSLEYRDIFKKIARQLGSDNWRDGFYLTPEETLAALRGRSVSISDVMRKRKAVGIAVRHPGALRFFDAQTTARFGRYLKELYGEKREKPAYVRELRGFPASGGKVKGTVKVVLSRKDFSKVSAGDILVAPHTSVDYIPVMERAAAFVTNEGGITSHASIVSREMGKPCVIGTKIATKVLKDGDLVEVNANDGTVKIIKKSDKK